MYKRNNISERINKLLSDNNITPYKICKDCSIPQSSFSRMIRSHWDWKVEHLVKIAEFFGVSLDYLILGKVSVSNSKLLDKISALNTENLSLSKKAENFDKIESILKNLENV